MKRCVWCAEDIDPKEDVCAWCGRDQRDGEGRALRRLDITYEEVVARQRRSYRAVMTWGVVGFAVAAVAAPIFAPAAPLVAAILLIVHMIILRIYLFRESFRLLSAKRRFFVRWIIRLGLVIAGSFGYSTTVAPIAGPLTGAGTFAILTAATNSYVLRSLRRERLGLPLELWEKITLILLAISVVVLIGLAIALGALVGWSIAELKEVFE